MRYQGGKERIARHLAPFLASDGPYVEPFVGGLSVGSRVEFGSAIFADGNPALITLYRAWADGWRPAGRIDEAHWKRLKAANDPDDPLTAFAGFGLSFGGRWFTSYCRETAGHSQDYYANAVNSLAAKLGRLAGRDVRFEVSDYLDLEIPAAAVVYCDPPYAGTTGYACAGAFDSAEFWGWAEGLARCDRRVYVSEYAAPAGWHSIWEKPCTQTMRIGKAAKTNEHLFTYNGEKQ